MFRDDIENNEPSSSQFPVKYVKYFTPQRIHSDDVPVIIGTSAT